MFSYLFLDDLVREAPVGSQPLQIAHPSVARQKALFDGPTEDA